MSFGDLVPSHNDLPINMAARGVGGGGGGGGLIFSYIGNFKNLLVRLTTGLISLYTKFVLIVMI